MRRHVLTAVLALSLAFCAWHAVELFSPPAPFAQLYLKATPAQNDAITRQMILITIVAPVVLAALLLAAWPALTVTRTRTCFALGTILIVTGIFGMALGYSLPYGFGSSYEHASDAQLLHMAVGIKGGGAYFALGLLFAVAGIIVRVAAARASSGPGA